MTLIGQLALALALVTWRCTRSARISLAFAGDVVDVLISARHALWAMAAMVALAAGCALERPAEKRLFPGIRRQLFQHHTADVYKITALWGGQQGSLLLWTLLLSVFTAIVAFQTRERNSEIGPYVLIMLALVAVFFLGMLNFVTRPFDPMIPVPAEGTDLNPLLQNYWMAIHPPSLYTGYVSTRCRSHSPAPH